MFLCLSLGGDRETIDDLKDITNLPLSYHGVDEDHYTYKLGTLIRFMQQHVELLISDPALVSQNVLQHYNENMAYAGEKTLYLVEDEIEQEIATEAQISKLYHYPFRIVEREEIKELIMAGDKDAIFLHKVGPEGKNLEARTYKILIGVAEAKIYYYEYHKVNAKHPDAFLQDDFKRLERANQKLARYSMADKPSIPKGTRDFSPLEMTRRNHIFDTVRKIFKDLRLSAHRDSCHGEPYFPHGEIRR